MTEKRFTNHDDTIIDTDGEQLISTDEIVDKMNELHEEIQELKHENAQYDLIITNNQLAYIDLQKENEELRKQREELFIRERDTQNDWRELKQENEQLRKDSTVLILANQDYRRENEQLKSKINKLDDELYSKECDVFDLKKENEQLKNKIDVLEDDNETYHKSLEKLNLYTKRFIPTKCTNEFKDCKTNRYYWLDHEGNFEGCLELLNLLDCEKEILKSENSHLKAKLMGYEEQLKGDVE